MCFSSVCLVAVYLVGEAFMKNAGGTILENVSVLLSAENVTINRALIPKLGIIVARLSIKRLFFFKD